LANRPGLILADEPTGSLDSAAGVRILELLKDLNRRGATVVVVTHDPEVARHSNRAVRMIDGRAFELDSGGRNVRHQDPVMPAAQAGSAFDAATLGTIAGVEHVKAAWGQVALTGGFSATAAAPSIKSDQLIALEPRAWRGEAPALVAGGMPSSDTLNQVVLSR